MRLSEWAEREGVHYHTALIVVEEREVYSELMRDITEVLRSMCARLYGRRSARRGAERAVRAAGEVA